MQVSLYFWVFYFFKAQKAQYVTVYLVSPLLDSLAVIFFLDKFLNFFVFVYLSIFLFKLNAWYYNHVEEDLSPGRYLTLFCTRARVKTHS